MATNVNIGGGGSLFVGEDKTLRFEVLDDDSLPVDVAGWAMVFDVRLGDAAAVALLSKTPTITGTYDAARATNTQRVVVSLTSANMDLFKATMYRYSLKRTDAESETVLAWGGFAPQKATAP